MMHVSTFYSFKGGVGRTLLLVNVGAALARSPRKVLLWDLDLEAPGMHHIEGLKAKRPPASGFLEWLMQWQESDFAPVEGHLLESFLGLPYEVPEIPGLFVLPAFGARSSFANLYQRIHWHAFTIERPELGRKLFETLLDGLSERLGPEHVLIDSRTGITDLGGLLTAVLPHTTVLVGNYSAQNTAGLLSIYRALQPAVAGKLPERRYGRLQRLLVASPVPLHESRQSLEERRSQWNSRFESPPDETRVEIPFLARLLFGEELLVETEPHSPTARAYQDVARRVAEMREERLLEEESTEASNLLYRDLARASLGADAGLARGRETSFAQKVEKLLQLLGYTVNRGGADSGADLIAQRKSGFLHERYLVVCKEVQRPLSQKQVVELEAQLRDASQREPGSAPMLVASVFSAAALEYARNQKLLALTLTDLQRELFDFKPYLTRLRRSYEESTLARTYVPPRLLLRPAESTGAEALERASAWARGEGSRLWLVVGEDGAGKSSFLQRFAYELATAAEKDERAPVPLLIPLKDSSALTSLESLLQEHMAASIGWRGDPSVLLYLLATGRLLLLLDGLDEMGAIETSPTMLEEQFRHLAQPTGPTTETPRGNRILITARAQYFRQQSRAGAFSAPSRLQEPLLGRVALALGAEVDEIAQWDRQQLREYLLRAMGPERAARWAPLVDQLEQQPELISRPLLLELLLLAGSEISTPDEALSLGTLFQRFTDRWTQRGERSVLQLSLEQWQRLFERLARELRGRPQGKLHQHQFLEFLKEALDEQLSTPDIGRLELALRGSPFLTRSPDGYYQFAFKLFEEFFFARHLLRAAREWKLEEALDTMPPTSECAAFLVEDADLTPLRQGVMKILGAPYRPRRSENALRLAYELACHLVGSAGKQSRMEMAAFVPRGAALEGADLRGGQWAFASFEGARMTGARLDGADLTDANLKEIEGQGLVARGCILDGACFEAANLQGADFSGSTALSHAPIFEHANLRGALLRGTAWQMPEFLHAQLDSPDIALARWHTSGSQDRNGQEVALSFAHPGWANGLAVSPDGMLLVTCAGTTPVLWDLASGRPLVTYAGHTQLVTGVAFSPDGKRVASASQDASVGLWDTAHGKLLYRLSGHPAEVRRVAFSPDGTLLAAGFNDGSVRVWHSETGSLLHIFKGHAAAVTSIAFAPEGSLLATGSDDQTIGIWDSLSKKHVRTLNGHGASIRAVAFHPDTPFQLASCSVDGVLKLWDVEQGATVGPTIESDGLWTMAFNGAYLAGLSISGELLVWSAETKALARRVLLGGSGGALAFVPGGTHQLAAATTRTILLERPDAALGVATTVGAGAVASTFLSGERLALGGEDGVIRVWDTRTGVSLLSLLTKGESVHGLAASQDGARLATAAWPGPVEIWDTESGKSLMLISDIEHVTQLAFSPNGQHLAGAGLNTQQVWDVSTARPRRIFTLEGHREHVSGISFSPDGQLLATASVDKTIRVWDCRTGDSLLTLEGHTAPVNGVTFSPDSMLIASVGSDRTVRLWSLPSGKPLVTLEGHADLVFRIVFSPAGDLLLTGSADETARVWSLRERRCIAVLEGHAGPVLGASFSPEGDRAVTASWDGTARLWDTATWRHLATFVWLDKAWATLAGSYALPSPDMDLDRLVVRAGAKCAPLSLFRDECIRPDLVRATLAGKPVEPLRLDLGAAERMMTRK